LSDTYKTEKIISIHHLKGRGYNNYFVLCPWLLRWWH